MPRHIALAAVAALLALAPLPAFAHAILLASTPASGGAVAAGPVAMELRFNSRIDRDRSVVRLAGKGGALTDLPLAPDTPPDILRTNADLAPGTYTIRWQVLAVDGHITRGAVPFTVRPR